MQEASDTYRVLDGAGAVLGEIAFGARSSAGLSKKEAYRMAVRMVAAGDVLDKAGNQADLQGESISAERTASETLDKR